MKYPADEDRSAIWWAILILLLVAMGFMLVSCESEARPPAPISEPATVFADIGATLAWTGGISAAAGLGLSLIALFYPPLQPFAVLFRIAGIGGAGVSVLGAAYLWVANHPWYILIAAGLVGVGVAWWCWPKLHRLIDRRLAAGRTRI